MYYDDHKSDLEECDRLTLILTRISDASEAIQLSEESLNQSDLLKTCEYINAPAVLVADETNVSGL